MNEQKPPVNVGEEFKVKVEAVGEKGDGIVKVKGFVLFVPGVQEGQTIKIKVNKVLSKVGFAEKIGDVEKEEIQEEKEEELPPVDDEPAPEDSEDFGEEESDDELEDSEEMDDSENEDTESEPEEPENKKKSEEDTEDEESDDDVIELPKDE